MKIERLVVRNFRAIDNVEIHAGTTMVVIAGPNGCGKSCVLDAIRFIKSTYGEYTPNEWNQWLDEFQIQRRQDRFAMKKVLRNKARAANIQIELRLHTEEETYIVQNLHQLATEIALSRIQPGMSFQQWAQQVRIRGQRLDGILAQIEQLAQQLSVELTQELSDATHTGDVEVNTDGSVAIRPNTVLQALWRVYEPGKVGLVDYHGAHRNYARELLGGVDLSLRTQEEQQKQSTLYNYANKYANIKSQMAAEYVLDMLRERAGAMPDEHQKLSTTLGELVKRFFPGKQFEGVTSNEAGELEFSVTVGGQQKHDINDLSSGEKEILFGYLRLRNSAQRHSIVLLDEPELHLNPKLIRGLPQFYQKYIGEDLDNQIWAVSHSDAFLREALQSSDTRVYHMREARGTGEQQVERLEGERDVDAAIFELIGDIAGYRPGGKVVIFEGEGSSFDLRMVGRLFPAYERRMNFVAAGDRQSVRRLHDALERIDPQQNRGQVFSIVDRDNEMERKDGERRFQWDVYHIENYLLDEEVIFDLLRSRSLEDTGFQNANEVEDALRALAESEVDKLVEHVVRAKAYREFRRAIKLRGGDLEGLAPAERVGRNIQESLDRLNELKDCVLAPAALEEAAEARKNVLYEALKETRWKKEFRGRDILKAFVKKYGRGERYEVVRDSIVVAMAEKGVRPPGMLAVLEQIDKYSEG